MRRTGTVPGGSGWAGWSGAGKKLAEPFGDKPCCRRSACSLPERTLLPAARSRAGGDPSGDGGHPCASSLRAAAGAAAFWLRVRCERPLQHPEQDTPQPPPCRGGQNKLAGAGSPGWGWGQGSSAGSWPGPEQSPVAAVAGPCYGWF